MQVRSRAMDVLFGMLRDYGPAFSASFWGLVYRGVLLPMFDDVKHCSTLLESHQAAAVSDAGAVACFLCCEGYGSYFACQFLCFPSLPIVTISLRAVRVATFARAARFAWSEEGLEGHSTASTPNAPR